MMFKFPYWEINVWAQQLLPLQDMLLLLPFSSDNLSRRSNYFGCRIDFTPYSKESKKNTSVA